MKTNLIIGPDIKIDINKLKSLYKKNGHPLTIYGDGKNFVNCLAFNFPPNANVIIYAHGEIDKEHNHRIKLCSDKSNEYLSTYATFESIFANNKPAHVMLHSCFSGAAIDDIGVLAPGSTLITSSPPEYAGIMSTNSEMLFRLASHSSKNTNHFIEFIKLLLTFPSVNKFGYRAKNSAESYTSSSINIKNYATEGIHAWLRNEINEFTRYARHLKKQTAGFSKEMVEDFLDEIEDSPDSLWLIHNTERYKELLLLFLAGWGKRQHIEQLLLANKKLNINALTIENETALFIASFNAKTESVKYLLNNSADIDLANIHGFTPLLIAAQHGNFDVAKILVDTKANLEAVTSQNITALYEASTRGYLNLVKLLAEAGANVETTNENGFTPLCVAVSKGHLGVVKYLVENGAKVNFITKKSLSAIMLAVIHDHSEIVEYLAENGADINIFAVLTPLHAAASLGHTKVVNVLLDKQAKTEIRDESGVTALYSAAKNGFEEIVDMLIKEGAQVNIKSPEGYTALMIACNNKHLTIVKLLLAAGVNSKEKYGEYTASNFGESIEIRAEIRIYENDAIAYVLKNNKNAGSAIYALDNLKTIFNQNENLIYLNEVKKCLETNIGYHSLHLNEVCGVNGSYYDHPDL